MTRLARARLLARIEREFDVRSAAPGQSEEHELAGEIAGAEEFLAAHALGFPAQRGDGVDGQPADAMLGPDHVGADVFAVGQSLIDKGARHQQIQRVVVSSLGLQVGLACRQQRE